MHAIADINPLWAPHPEILPAWFHSALAVPREEGFVEVDGTRPLEPLGVGPGDASLGRVLELGRLVAVLDARDAGEGAARREA